MKKEGTQKKANDQNTEKMRITFTKRSTKYRFMPETITPALFPEAE